MTEAILAVEQFNGPIWEPASGEGHMVAPLLAAGHEVIATDVTEGIDILMEFIPHGAQSIVTNPPFGLAEEFCRHAIELMREPKGKVCMLLPATFDTAKGRRDLFKAPFKVGLILTNRIRWAKP